MQSFLKQPSNFFNKTKIGAKSLLSSGKKLGSTLMGTPIKVAQKLLPPTKQLAKERRENDSSQFVKNYLDFFGAKKTAKVLRNNLKITRNALVDMFETTKLLKIQIGNITDSLKMKGGKKKGGLLGGLLGGGLGMLSGLLSAASLLTNPVVLGILGVIGVGGITALLANKGTREAIFGFLKNYAAPVVGFLKDSIFNVLKENFPNIFLAVTDPLGLAKNIITAPFGGNTPADIDIKFNELNDELAAAGMDKEGTPKNIKGSARRFIKDLPNEGRTPEQQIIYERVTGQKNQLEDLKKQIKYVEGEVPKSESYQKRERGKMKTFYKHSDEDKELIKQKQEEIIQNFNYAGKSGEDKEVSDNKVESSKDSKEVKEVSESKVEGVKEGDIENVKADTSKNMDIVKNIEKPIEEESDDPIIEYVPTAMSGSNNEPQVMGGSSDTSPAGGGSPSIVFFPSKNFDTISDQTAKSLMNIVDG